MLLVRFEHTTSGLSERSLRPFCHSATWEESVEIKSQVCMYDQYYVILIRWQKIIWFVCLLFRHVRRGCDCPFIGCFNLTEFFMLRFCSKKVGWNSFLNYFFIAFCAKRSCSLYLINYIFLNFQNSRKTVTFCITYTYIYKPKFFVRIVYRCASPAPSVFPFDKKS